MYNIIMDCCKIVCINLERRPDRKQSMLAKFAELGLTNYEFFRAVDGANIESGHPQLRFFRHDCTGVLKRGIAGAALSHYNIWLKLLSDQTYNMYLVLEDDINMVSDIRDRLDQFIKQMDRQMDVVLIGMTVEKKDYDSSRSIYLKDTSYTIHPLTDDLYAGGAFGYILTKTGADKLVKYVEMNGIKMVIDYLMYRSGINIYETHPHLVFTESVQHSGDHVDSDIQHDDNRIKLEPISNYHMFDDYIFYPNQDSGNGDIMQLYADVSSLKKIADSMDDCVAFNTYGWLKHTIVPPKNFCSLKNWYYAPDGMYVKKSYFAPKKVILNELQQQQNSLKAQLENKLARLKNLDRPLVIFINKNARLYTSHIVQMILSNFTAYRTVITMTDACDVSIGHITEEYHYCSNNTLNILISGEAWNLTKIYYDIAIDTKCKPTAAVTIYYPFIFSSIHEHKKSCNPKDYVNDRNCFCAYMYHISYEHRIEYFHLVSTYKKVDALGKCCNNIDILDTRDKYDQNETYNDIAVGYYTHYKFVLAIENTFVEGYSTEKLMNPLIANSIPIYWGHPYIFKYINKKRVIYIPDFKTDQELLDRIAYLDTNNEAYEQIVKEDIYADPAFTIDKFEEGVRKCLGQLLNFSDFTHK